MGVLRVKKLDISSLPENRKTRLEVEMVANGLGQDVLVPVVVARGARPGPVVGLTAAIHGNELNGVRVIHRLLAEIDTGELRGTVVTVPVINVPGYLASRREFNDGSDLNRIMPGKARGSTSEVYAHRVMTRIIDQFNYLIDLHTASFGRINSLYVRADMMTPETEWMARSQLPQVIVHNRGADGTLRAAAMERGIAAITVEVGDPQRFQGELVRHSAAGVRSVLAHLLMLPYDRDLPSHEPIICSRSFWIYTDRGGILDVLPKLLDRVEEGEILGRVRNVYGDVIAEYHAPEAGVVVGKSTNPVNQTGSRILHLGVLGEPS